MRHINSFVLFHSLVFKLELILKRLASYLTQCYLTITAKLLCNNLTTKT